MTSLMWTATTCVHHRGGGLASDVTDAEWALIEPLLPARSSVGRPPEWPMRQIVNAIFYVLHGGIPSAWRDGGVWQSVTQHLVMQDREHAGRETSPSAALIDSQSVKTTEAGGSRGYHAGNKVQGHKRHAMVDTSIPMVGHLSCRFIPRPCRTAMERCLC
jgi:transposase